jgi:hypothetical protein
MQIIGDKKPIADGQGPTYLESYECESFKFIWKTGSVSKFGIVAIVYTKGERTYSLDIQINTGTV